MRKLNLFAVETADHLVQPAEFADTSLDTAALEFVTDFKHNSPMMIDAETCAVEAEDMMKHEHSKLKLVIDANQEMIGLISFEQLSIQNVLQRMGKGINRKDLTVADLMLPRSEVKALAYQQLQHCSIGDVLHTLQSHGEQYCLVIDTDSHHIRGLMSAADIASRLHVPVHIEKTPTFLNIFDRVYA
ncbi:histidine kinase [Rheinheimera sp.]|uniref:histidine kinase n=1 Tax=Rheinheimera sp. TaxID=1869214 RepID=UPI00307F08E5